MPIAFRLIILADFLIAEQIIIESALSADYELPAVVTKKLINRII